MKTLYICYFGLKEPLVQTQVLPYLRELARGGVQVHLLTFEPDFKTQWPRERREREAKRLAGEGVQWSALAYHKWPTMPATLLDVLAGVRRAKKLMRRHGIGVVHARSHVPGLMGILLQRLIGCKLVFDLRGLMAEEYQDAGIWTPDSTPFRLTKWIEHTVLRRADRIVTLTNRAADWLIDQGIARDRIRVIPCCVDVSRFTGADGVEPEHRGLRDQFTVVYAGSVVGLYLLKEMLRFVRALRARRADAHFLVLTSGDSSFVRAAAKEEGLPEGALTVLRVAPEKVPHYVAMARAGLSFRKPAFSQIAASPTKIPEYLAAGIPIVTNAGIGDTDEIIRAGRVGLVLEELSEKSLERAAEDLFKILGEKEPLAQRCRETARRFFSLEEVGGPRYREVYESMSAAEPRRVLAAR